MRRAFLIVETVALAACLLACNAPAPKVERGGTEKGARPVADKDLQVKREKVIQGLLDNGVFKSVTYDKTATIVVGPKFYGLDFEVKVMFVKVVAAYRYKVPKDDSFISGEDVFLEDSKTGKIVGIFNDRGLNLD